MVEFSMPYQRMDHFCQDIPGCVQNAGQSLVRKVDLFYGFCIEINSAVWFFEKVNMNFWVYIVRHH